MIWHWLYVGLAVVGAVTLLYVTAGLLWLYATRERHPKVVCDCGDVIGDACEPGIDQLVMLHKQLMHGPLEAQDFS